MLHGKSDDSEVREAGEEVCHDVLAHGRPSSVEDKIGSVMKEARAEGKRRRRGRESGKEEKVAANESKIESFFSVGGSG